MAPPPVTVRDRILDAAVETAASHGLARLSVGDVAKRAGLSRQTLYKHFPSREVLVADAVLREAGRIVEQVIEAADAHESPQDSVQAAIVTTLRLTREHPLLDRLVRTEPEALLPLLVGDSTVAVAVRAVVEQITARKLPDVPPADQRRAADLLSRVLISYAISPPDDDPEEMARFMAAMVVAPIPDPTPPSRR